MALGGLIVRHAGVASPELPQIDRQYLEVEGEIGVLGSDRQSREFSACQLFAQRCKPVLLQCIGLARPGVGVAPLGWLGQRIEQNELIRFAGLRQPCTGVAGHAV